MSKIKKISSAILFSYLLFPFYFKGVETITQAFIYGASTIIVLCSLPYLLNRLRINDLKNNIIAFIMLCLLILDAIILIASLHFTNDYSYCSSFLGDLRNFLRVTAGIIFIQKIILRKDIDDKKYISLCTNAICIYVIASFVLLVPSIRIKWLNFISISDTNADMTNAVAYYTRFGLQGFSGFMHTCICNIGILLLLCKSVIRTEDIIKIILLMIGCICYGRIGLIGATSLIVIYFITKGRCSKILIAITVTSIILLLGFYIFYDQLRSEPWFYWAFEPIIKYYENGSFESSSSNELKDMWFLPSPECLLFGEGRYTNIDRTYYMHTDVGVLRRVLFGGSIFTGLLYIANICPLIALWKYNKHNKLLIYGSILLIILFESKGEAIGYFATIFFPFYFTKKIRSKGGTI